MPRSMQFAQTPKKVEPPPLPTNPSYPHVILAYRSMHYGRRGYFFTCILLYMSKGSDLVRLSYAENN